MTDGLPKSGNQLRRAKQQFGSTLITGQGEMVDKPSKSDRYAPLASGVRSGLRPRESTRLRAASGTRYPAVNEHILVLGDDS